MDNGCRVFYWLNLYKYRLIPESSLRHRKKVFKSPDKRYHGIVVWKNHFYRQNKLFIETSRYVWDRSEMRYIIMARVNLKRRAGIHREEHNVLKAKVFLSAYGNQTNRSLVSLCIFVKAGNIADYSKYGSVCALFWTGKIFSFLRCFARSVEQFTQASQWVFNEQSEVEWCPHNKLNFCNINKPRGW